MSKKGKVTQKEIADHLGVSTRTVGRQIKKGMPNSSVEEAADWYSIHADVKNTPLSHRKEKPMDLGPFHATEMESLNLTDQLAALKVNAKYQQQKMENSAEDAASYVSWNRVFLETTKMTLAIEKEIFEIRMKAKEVIPLEDLREGLQKCVSDFLTILDNIATRSTTDLRGKEKAKVKRKIQGEVDLAKNRLRAWQP